MVWRIFYNLERKAVGVYYNSNLQKLSAVYVIHRAVNIIIAALLVGQYMFAPATVAQLMSLNNQLLQWVFRVKFYVFRK
jgi:hypothetical protein